MSTNYPLEYTLEDGVRVLVNKAGVNTYNFTLTPQEGTARHFTFHDDENRTRDEKTGVLDFDQLNAVRRFWLEQHDVL